MDIDHLAEDDVTVFLIGQLAGDTRAYARDRRRACKRMVAEIFSPPRVVKHLSRFPNEQLVPGFSLDLTCLDPSDGKPWNFDLKAKRDKALHMVRTLQPLFLIGSPPCTHWSSWQALNVSKPGHDTEVTRRARIQALVTCASQ